MVDTRQALERLRHIADAAKALRNAGLSAETVEELLNKEFPDYAGAWSLLSDATKDKLKSAHTEVAKDRDIDLHTKAGRWETIKRAACPLGGEDPHELTKFFDLHPDAAEWHRAGADGEAEVEKVRSVSELTVKERIEKKFDAMARELMSEFPELDYAHAYDSCVMSDTGRELYQLYSDPWAATCTVSQFKETLTKDCGETEAHRVMLRKRLAEI